MSTFRKMISHKRSAISNKTSLISIRSPRITIIHNTRLKQELFNELNPTS
jgi:hypothetical protein